MLCPQCEQPAPGGSLCPVCGAQVPDRETFEGQGTHYFLVLAAITLLLVAGSLIWVHYTVGVGPWLRSMLHEPWVDLYGLSILFPFGLGVYYWWILREEEVSISDEAISRSSHWGDERMAWEDVVAYRQRQILLRQTRLGRMAWVSRVMRNHKLVADIATLRYELVGPARDGAQAPVFALEPGTLDDMPWLLRLIEERVGPPTAL